MKKFCFLLAALMLTAALVSCAGTPKEPVSPSNGTCEAAQTAGPQSGSNPSGAGGAKEFTSLVQLEYDFVEFCLPEDRDGNTFKDMGANCWVTVDRYGNDVAAYHEYDNNAEIEKKTVGDYTFDYQKFNYLNIPDWRMYVIRIEHNHEYYRFIYNVNAQEYDDAQVEKFMQTISFMH